MCNGESQSWGPVLDIYFFFSPFRPSLTANLSSCRFLATYMRPFPGTYFTGDGAIRDKDGYLWITGRVDDVLNVSGHVSGAESMPTAACVCVSMQVHHAVATMLAPVCV